MTSKKVTVWKYNIGDRVYVLSASQFSRRNQTGRVTGRYKYKPNVYYVTLDGFKTPRACHECYLRGDRDAE